ncbi:MAG: hypothetical protein WCQ60_01775 [bacterium]
MNAKVLPPKTLPVGSEVFKTKRTRSLLAPNQDGRIGWAGNPRSEYFCSIEENMWKLVEPKPKLELFPPRRPQVAPTSTTEKPIHVSAYMFEGSVEEVENVGCS